jgi:hypothetical protein
MRFLHLSTAIAAAISMSLFGFFGAASAGDGPQAYVTSGSGPRVREVRNVRQCAVCV